jgi:uroporphyrinogen decarboxylase
VIPASAGGTRGGSRDRVFRAIRFRRPDRLPVSHAVLPAAQLKYGRVLNDLLAEYRDDFGWDYQDDLPVGEFSAQYRPGLNRDAFGTLWRVEWPGICGIPVEGPVPDLDRYDPGIWPKEMPVGPGSRRQYCGHLLGPDERWYSRGGWFIFFEQLQQMRGMESLFLDLASEPAGLVRLMDDLLRFNLDWIDRFTALPYDGLHFGDDWGSQTGLLIRPAQWRRLFKPRYAEMFKRVREAGKDVWFHSDGFINEIAGDLVEIGVNVLNFQVAVCGHDWAERNLRGRLAVRTDIDRQRILPFGVPSEVRDEVARTLACCGTAEGGLIACGEIGPDVPFENIRAMYEAFREFGSPGPDG